MIITRFFPVSRRDFVRSLWLPVFLGLIALWPRELSAQQFQTFSSVVHSQAPLPSSIGPLVPAAEGGFEAQTVRMPTPPLPPGPGNLPQPESLPTVVEQLGLLVPRAAGDYKEFIKAEIPAVATGNPAGFWRPMEPSVAYLQDTGLLVANKFAALSKDSGKTWGQTIDPILRFPPRTGGADGAFNGDQRVLYIASRDVMIWYIQYGYSTTLGDGHFKLLYFVGRNALRTLTPTGFYDVVPQNLGFPAGRWFDFPDLAESNGYLSGTSNVYQGGGGPFAGNTVWRIELGDLVDGGPTVIQSFFHQDPNGLASMRFTQGAANTMRWATNRKNTTTLTLFYWIDGAGNTAQGPDDKTVPQWNTAAPACPGPDGRDWAGDSDHRIVGGYLNLPAQELGFLWDSAAMPGNNRPQPFVRTAIFRTTDHALLRTEDTFNNTSCYMYPAAAPNARGHVGVTVAVGSNTTNVTSGAFIVDDFVGTFDSQMITRPYDGTNGAVSNRWGDYFTVVPHPIDTNTWIGTGACMRGGAAASNQRCHSVWFGRERDEPAWVALDVQSTNVNAVPITVDETDRSGDKNGQTFFTRSYAPSQGYTLTAPVTAADGVGVVWAFERWSVRYSPAGQFFDQPVGQNRYENPDIQVENDLAIAKYVRRRELAVNSNLDGVAIALNVLDIFGTGNGATNFTRDFRDGTQVTLTAPGTFGAAPFLRWNLDGVAQPNGQTALQVTMGADRTAEVLYSSIMVPGLDRRGMAVLAILLLGGGVWMVRRRGRTTSDFRRLGVPKCCRSRESVKIWTDRRETDRRVSRSVPVFT